jgi:hypothetical protein
MIQLVTSFLDLSLTAKCSCFVTQNSGTLQARDSHTLKGDTEHLSERGFHSDIVIPLGSAPFILEQVSCFMSRVKQVSNRPTAACFELMYI